MKQLIPGVPSACLAYVLVDDIKAATSKAKSREPRGGLAPSQSAIPLIAVHPISGFRAFGTYCSQTAVIGIAHGCRRADGSFGGQFAVGKRLRRSETARPTPFDGTVSIAVLAHHHQRSGARD